ncbi:MAG TPA: hypothetical protein PKU97_16565, partial [Kofleriaceae bacterium]|nr:hypothetical protein [Kofleriaceae bacterium]
PHSSRVLQLISQWDYWKEPPQVCSMDGDEVPAERDWVEQLQSCRKNGRAFWTDYKKQLGINKGSELVFIGAPSGFFTLDEALAILEPLPFEICALGATFFEEWIAADYPRTGFGRSTITHGWGCMFRGAGHDRLASRRWLDFGPWRVLRRPDDTTFIQFHDLAITDPAEAYEQAKAGHARMGISPTGGYIAWHMQGLLKGAGQGLYTASERLLEVVVGPGNTVTQAEMLCNAALRLHHRSAPTSTPVERVAYVFVNEPDARAHLHELWLRELECWVVDDKGKRRLDLDYHPVPDPPAWVKRLDGR